MIRDDVRSAVVLQSPEAMFGAAAQGTCERKFPAWSSGGAEEVPALGEQVQFFREGDGWERHAGGLSHGG